MTHEKHEQEQLQITRTRIGNDDKSKFKIQITSKID